MKIKNVGKTLLSMNLPTGSLHLAGHTVSRELTEEEFKSTEVQKAIIRRIARPVRPKTFSDAGTAPFTKKVAPVARPGQPVADSDPNTSSDSQ